MVKTKLNYNIIENRKSKLNYNYNKLIFENFFMVQNMFLKVCLLPAYKLFSKGNFNLRNFRHVLGIGVDVICTILVVQCVLRGCDCFFFLFESDIFYLICSKVKSML